MERRRFSEICLDFFRKEDVQRYAKDLVRPVVNVVYNQVYPYVWTICLYCVFLFFLTLANLVLIVRMYYALQVLYRQINVTKPVPVPVPVLFDSGLDV
jgi:hypothetical protein